MGTRRAALLAGLVALAACQSPPASLVTDAAVQSDAWQAPENCASGLAFEDISSLSPDLQANRYGGEPGWDHVDKYGPGVGLADLDGDGYLDIVQVRAERNVAALRPPVVYRGVGDGRFQEAARPAWREQDNGTFALLFDYDQDQDIDILIGVAGGDPVLYRNDGAFAFTQVSAQAGLSGIVDHAYAAVAGDVDGDGDLDLYLGQWRADLPDHGPGMAENLLLLNQGGVFSTAEQDLRCDGRSTLGLAMADLDGDSDLDIYVANDFFEDCLYENLGSEGWREIGRSAGISTDAMHAMGVGLGDVNEDGLLDILVTDTEQPDSSRGNALFLRQGSGYQSAALAMGLDGISTLQADWLVSWGIGLEDFDRDGHLDVHVATHTEREELFFHNEGGTYAPAWDLIQGLEEIDARGTAYGDIDGDGDVDIVVGRRGGGLQILRNLSGQENRGLRVIIEPIELAIGATVRVQTEQGTQVRVIQAGSSFMSSSPAVASFGLCGAQTALSVEVQLVNGSSFQASEVPAGDYALLFGGFDLRAAAEARPAQ